MVALHIRSEPGALFLIVFLWSLPVVLARIVNRTIDDQFGDSDTLQRVNYLPTTSTVWQDQSCSGCLIQPDISRAFKETYTAATYNPQLGSMNITMKFNGTAIYAFFILANNAGDGITSLTLANFTLDGTKPELFQHAPDLTRTSIDYNQLVYSKQDLINAEHTLVISTSGVDTNVYVNFDYVIYTHDDDAPLLPLPSAGTSSASLSQSSSTASSLPRPTSTTHISQHISGTSVPNSGTALSNTSDAKSSPPVGPIVGGVIGGIVILLLVAFLLFFRRRRASGRHRLEAEGYIPPLMEELEAPMGRQAMTVTPFITQPTRAPFSGISGNQRGHNKNSSDALHHQMSPPSRDNHENAIGGHINPNPNGPAKSLYASGPQYRNRSARPPLRSVTDGDHISSPDTSLGVYSTTVTSANSNGGEGHAAPNSVEAIRRARQNEIDARLRAVQQEVTHLTSDLRGEKGGRQLSVRRRRADTPGHREVGEEEEMSMAEMREQLRVMKEQIGHLREQQRSAWAQGLSDDPPPGYTLNPALRNSGPTVVPPD